MDYNRVMKLSSSLLSIFDIKFITKMSKRSFFNKFIIKILDLYLSFIKVYIKDYIKVDEFNRLIKYLSDNHEKDFSTKENIVKINEMLFGDVIVSYIVKLLQFNINGIINMIYSKPQKKDRKERKEKSACELLLERKKRKHIEPKVEETRELNNEVNEVDDIVNKYI
jgi:hypothetical protein